MSARGVPAGVFTFVPAALFALAVAGCSELLSDPFEYGTVEVSAELESGEPLPGVQLTLYTGTRSLGTGVTDADGRWLFSFVPAGSTGVATEPPPGYRLPGASYTTFSMNEGDRRTVRFTFEACAGSISVRVIEERGGPVEGAGLLLYAPRGILDEVTTDAAGRYRFADVPCGRGYAVKVTPPAGHSVEEGPGTSYHDGLTVDEGGPVGLEFVLTRLDG